LYGTNGHRNRVVRALIGNESADIAGASSSRFR
jgi:hypothetical protein